MQHEGKRLAGYGRIVPVVLILHKAKPCTHACSLILFDFDLRDRSCSAEGGMQQRLCNIWVQVSNIHRFAAAGIKGPTG